MAYIQCPQGHFYDGERFADCPHCAGSDVPPAGTRAGMDDSGTIGMDARRGKNAGAAVGWLVVTQGADMGKDYRLICGRNTLGRDPDMDVCLRHDQAVSRVEHAYITYDERTNRFFLSAGRSKNTIYQNGEPLVEARELSAYDLIEAGQTRLLFVPLCGEKFRWT